MRRTQASSGTASAFVCAPMATRIPARSATLAIGGARESLAPAAAECSERFSGRPHQRELTHDTVAALETPSLTPTAVHSQCPRSSALVVVPTGGGKTHVALSAARVIQREAGLRVGWCASRRELLRQAQAENVRFQFDVDMSLISLFDRDPPRCDLLIMDEAHHDACVSAANLQARVRATYVIGLTATPWRTDRARLSYSHVLRRCSIQSLQDDGFLSRYVHVSIDSWQPEPVAATWLSSRERFGKSVMFFRTRAEATRCVGALRDGGASADLVTGASDREAQIEAFAAGQTDVLVAMGCLCEGFSDPSIATVFVRPASRGPTVQMAGRAFRRHPDIPLKTIVQSRDTPVPFTRVARPAEQYLLEGGAWRALGATPQLDSVVHRMRCIAARAPVTLPGLLTAAQRHRPATELAHTSTSIDATYDL
jgi:superfamily II DNA or RNA helicase